MIQKKLSPILIAIAMILTILNYDLGVDFSSKKFWMFIISLIVLAAAIIMIYNNQNTENTRK